MVIVAIPIFIVSCRGSEVQQSAFWPGRNWRTSHSAFAPARAAQLPQCRGGPWTPCSEPQTRAWGLKWTWAASCRLEQAVLGWLPAFSSQDCTLLKGIPPSIPVLLPRGQFPCVCFPQFGGQNAHYVDKEQEIYLRVQENGLTATSGIIQLMNVSWTVSYNNGRQNGDLIDPLQVASTDIPAAETSSTVTVHGACIMCKY